MNRRIVLELRKRRGAKNVSACNYMMRLRSDELVLFSGFVQSENLRTESSIAGPKSIAAKSNVFADAPRARTAITEMKRDRVVSLAGHDPHRGFHRVALESNTNYVFIL